MDVQGPAATVQERRAVVSAWRAVPYRVRKDVVRAARAGRAHPDQDVARAAAAYARLCQLPRGPRWYQRSLTDRAASWVLLALALVLAAGAVLVGGPDGGAPALDWAGGAAAVWAAAVGLFRLELRRECRWIVAASGVHLQDRAAPTAPSRAALVRAGLRPRRRARHLLPLGPVGGQRASTALWGIALLYAGGWGVGLYSAITSLVSPGEATPGSWLDAGAWVGDSLFAGALVVWAALLFAASRGVSPRNLGLQLPRGGARWWAAAATGGAYAVLSWLAFAVGDLISSLAGETALSYPQGPSAADSVSSVVSSLAAGPTEEVVLLAVPVALLRRAGWSWPRVLVLDVVMRVSFHAYYGWGCLGLVVWTTGVFLLHARTGSLLALVVAHSLLDVLDTVEGVWDLGAVDTWLMTAAVLLTVLGILTGAFRSPAGAAGDLPAGARGRGPGRRATAAPARP